MPFENFKNYSESTIEATFEQYDKLSCKLALKLNNNRTFFEPYYDIVMYEKVKKAVINCLKPQEVKGKTKLLERY